jgi:hypothetical protein
MDEVIGKVTALQTSSHRLKVEDVTFDYLDLITPWVQVEPRADAGHAPDIVSGLQQLGNESTPHITGRTGNKNTRHLSLTIHAGRVKPVPYSWPVSSAAV